MTARAHSVRDVVAIVRSAARERAGSPLVVGVSGFGGAGKSTLARALVEGVDGAVRLRGDDFLDPVRSHERSRDWSGVERARLRAEVLEPLASGRRAVFRRYDWAAGSLGAEEVLEPADVLVVDAVGLFHPELDGCFDLRIWVDVSLDEATRRGVARDRAAGHDHDDLWRTVWVPNERAFAEAFRPREHADVWYAAEPDAAPRESQA